MSGFNCSRLGVLDGREQKQPRSEKHYRAELPDEFAARRRQDSALTHFHDVIVSPRFVR